MKDCKCEGFCICARDNIEKVNSDPGLSVLAEQQIKAAVQGVVSAYMPKISLDKSTEEFRKNYLVGFRDGYDQGYKNGYQNRNNDDY